MKEKMNKRIDSKNLLDFRYKFAQKYYKSYSKTIIYLFIIIILKKLITHETTQMKEIGPLLVSLGMFSLISYQYNKSK